MTDMKRPILDADGRYRTVGESIILEQLVMYTWPNEARSGEAGPGIREARAALERWIDLGLPCAQAEAGGRCFDPAEVMNFMKWAGARHGDPYWEDRYVEAQRDLIRGFHSSTTEANVAPAPSALSPRRFVVTLCREFDLRGNSAGTRTALRLPLPLEDEALRDLEVDCIAPTDVDIDFRVAPGRLDARFTAPHSPTIALSVRLAFTACAAASGARPAELSESDRDLYTRPTEALVRISPQVAALAARLAGSEKDPWTVSVRFWNYVLDELTCGVVDYQRLDEARPLDHVLDNGWFDCQLSSALLTALCRSRDIPARVVSGYLIYPARPSYHWWTEVWLADRGWVPLDTMCSDLSVRGRDAGWRDYFLGELDYRMKSEVLPRHFNRSPGLRLPLAWRMLTRADAGETGIALVDCATGVPAFRDRIAIRQM